MLAPPNAYAPVSRAPSPAHPGQFSSAVDADVLAKWKETAAVIIANKSPSDTMALTNLGDVLAANGWLQAAHAW